MLQLIRLRNPFFQMNSQFRLVFAFGRDSNRAIFDSGTNLLIDEINWACNTAQVFQLFQQGMNQESAAVISCKTLFQPSRGRSITWLLLSSSHCCHLISVGSHDLFHPFNKRGWLATRNGDSQVQTNPRSSLSREYPFYKVIAAKTLMLGLLVRIVVRHVCLHLLVEYLLNVIAFRQKCGKYITVSTYVGTLIYFFI